MILRCLLDVAALPVIMASDPRETIRNKDHEKLQGKDLVELQGTWVISASEVGGKSTPQEEVRQFRNKITISGKTYTNVLDSLADRCVFEIDPKVTPGAITFKLD